MTDVIIQHLITEQKGMLVQAILLNYKWMSLDQAFSQTLKTGHPEGMFFHKIIRDSVNFPCISSKNECP